MSRGKSVIPRGFSRYYVLSLLNERPMTGKEIIEETLKRSDGAWKPSPGLVYPLLGRLLAEGLIEEADHGYKLTEKGERTLQDYMNSKKELERTLEGLIRLFMFGGFIAKDFIERLSFFFKILEERVNELTAEQREKYKKFLQEELRKLEEAR
jgi:DNA-binding PadR family transcriptional regulator